jgi:hypothetical protein
VTEQPSTRYRFAATDRTGWLLGLSGAQCLILAGGLTAAGVLLPMSAPAALVMLVLAAVVAFTSWDDQPGYAHVATRGRWTAQRATRRDAWTSPAPLHPPSVRTLQLPATFGRLRVWSTGGPAPVAVIEDRRGHSFTALVPIGGRPLSLREPGEQQQVLAGWGDVLGALSNSRNPIARVTVSEWAGPAADLNAPHIHDAPNEAVTASYRELVADAAPASRRHESLLAVTVRPPRSRGGPRLSGVAAAVEQARLLAQRLDALGLEPGRTLTAAELARLLRCRLDPHTSVGTSQAFRSAGPMSQRADWDRVQIDGSVHAVYWVAEWPRLPVTATWLEPLVLHTGGIRTFTILFEPVTARDSARRVRRDATRIHADEQQRQRGGWRIDAAHHRTRDEIDEREAELAAGYAELNYLGLLTVTAATPAQLEASCRSVEDAAAQTGLEVRRLNGNHHHLLPVAVGFLGRPVSRPRVG